MTLAVTAGTAAGLICPGISLLAFIAVAVYLWRNR